MIPSIASTRCFEDLSLAFRASEVKWTLSLSLWISAGFQAIQWMGTEVCSPDRKIKWILGS